MAGMVVKEAWGEELVSLMSEELEVKVVMEEMAAKEVPEVWAVRIPQSEMMAGEASAVMAVTAVTAEIPIVFLLSVMMGQLTLI